MPEKWNDMSKRYIYDIPNLGAIEYSRVNPLDASDVRENFSWRRVLNLGEADGNMVIGKSSMFEEIFLIVS